MSPLHTADYVSFMRTASGASLDTSSSASVGLRLPALPCALVGTACSAGTVNGADQSAQAVEAVVSKSLADLKKQKRLARNRATASVSRYSIAYSLCYLEPGM